MFDGDQNPVVGVSSVPTHALTTRPSPSRTVRVIVPSGVCTLFTAPVSSNW